MSSEDLISIQKSLIDCNSSQFDEISGKSLGSAFQCCVKAHQLIENSSLSSNNDEVQSTIKTTIETLEKCTKMVNELELFGSNETIEEVQTSSLKFLLLPVLLGSLEINLQNKDLSERLRIISISEVYFKDFLLRCKNYEICSTDFKDVDDETFWSSDDAPNHNSDLKAVREKKIQQHKRKIELSKKLDDLKPCLERNDSDENQRDYYHTLLEKWILTAFAELDNIRNEKNILKSMIERGQAKNSTPPVPKVKPLQPIIITKNEVQKRVFGLGYPSIPVMTIEDFYRQRFEGTIEKQNSTVKGASLQERAARDGDSGKEAEDIEKEQLLERDDPQAIMKARQWDEWKDDNPRGSGNRYNKG